MGQDAQPLRHQVWELPPIEPHVTEYQLHRLTCPCGTTTCAALPPGVPSGQAGPRLIAFTALLMAYYRQSKRRTAEFLTPLLGVPCCATTTVKMQSATGSRFVETMLTVIETCRQQGRRTCDYLTSALLAHFARQKTPSLLPGP